MEGPKTNPASKIESTERQLTSKEVAMLVWRSFKFSQGDSDLQLLLLRSAKDYYGNQESFSLDEADFRLKELIGEDSFKLANKNNHIRVEVSTLKAEFSNFINYFKALTSKPTKTIENLTDFDFLQMFIDRDRRFLLPISGRPNRDSLKIGDNSLADRYFSFFVHHILRNNTSGEKAFDVLFTNWRNNMKEYISKGDILRSVSDIVERYNDNHPDTPVTKDELAKIGIITTNV